NVDGMNIISNDGSNKLNRSRKARVSNKVQRTINASLNAATSTRAVSSNPNFVTRQKIEIRSEERFSRNAETDLVCRLLLEKKKTRRRSRRPARRASPHRDRSAGPRTSYPSRRRARRSAYRERQCPGLLALC